MVSLDTPDLCESDGTNEDIFLFDLEIDEDIYTLRKTSYKKGKVDYPKWEPDPNWDEERLIQYRNGYAYSEWLCERTCL